jgi:hypothetical protein
MAGHTIHLHPTWAVYECLWAVYECLKAFRDQLCGQPPVPLFN